MLSNPAVSLDAVAIRWFPDRKLSRPPSFIIDTD